MERTKLSCAQRSDTIIVKEMNRKWKILLKLSWHGDSLSVGAIVGIVTGTIVIVLVLLALAFVFNRRRKSYKEVDFQSGDDISTTHSLQFDFKTIEAATDKFSRSNRLGQGGFGEVYKGTFPNGTEVAVKRLSKNSGQGEKEFKNEVLLVAKLQHRNLVRLLGFSVEGEEKILVYEFVPNKSLDYFLFAVKRQLDWKKRYSIIGGISRGIIYLHQDSRLTIIHRDLKASNILLDADMDPKIADFGMARIFGMDQSGANTSKIVGTPGYMSPEYLIHGQFSTKSDVYSYGVLVLEIISGRKNNSFHQTSDATAENLAWKLWGNGTALNLVDPVIIDSCQNSEVIRCIHICLLCVQEDPVDRPTFATISVMLTSNTVTLPVPRQPGFFIQSRSGRDPLDSDQSTATKSDPTSVDDASITDIYSR
ncbi:unnamed protein product [Eruca vesicaria subsp. sativa]|uniref:Protein kinase domain-containing protein n=1 Tax=Eruca vesicaria subsp. sativa TaxID=29727 RepID=A0ABC8KM45_ERUVS|nr:unnamed protein product [Eruca vesicaria subsp. sativa]